MKRPYRDETEAKTAAKFQNERRGSGRTGQEPYPCPDCSEDGPETWHTRTDKTVLIDLGGRKKKTSIKRHRPAARPEHDEDLEGKWAA